MSPQELPPVEGRPQAQAVRLLRERGQSVATAESLTAGLISASLAEVPGASAVLRGGVVSYAAEVKEALLGVDPEVIAEITHRYGFDKPIHERYFKMLWDYIRFDFGDSLFRSSSVLQLIKDSLPVSVSLGLWSTLIIYLVSIPLGIKKAVSDGSAFDVWTSGVIIVGYTDFPSRMAAQSSTLYANNIRHMMADLTPAKDGALVHNMEDDVIRGATVTRDHDVTWPPPPPKVQAIAVQKPKEKARELTPEERRANELAEFKRQTRSQVGMLVTGGVLMLLVGLFAPASFMAHFIVFVLACFIGFSVIWNVAHSLHTPLMAVTNAISAIVIVGAMLAAGLTEGLAGQVAGTVAVALAQKAVTLHGWVYDIASGAIEALDGETRRFVPLATHPEVTATPAIARF